MEMTKIEGAVIAQVLSEVDTGSIQELSELQLALIGGGNGEITPY